MPIRNVATLLENIVLVEAAGILFAETGIDQIVEFVNPFAMPPLSAWQPHELDRGFDASHLAYLASVADTGNRPLWSTFMSLLGDIQPVDLSQGPSGALLVGLLARRTGRQVRMWLGDLPDNQGSHYRMRLRAYRACRS